MGEWEFRGANLSTPAGIIGQFDKGWQPRANWKIDSHLVLPHASYILSIVQVFIINSPKMNKNILDIISRDFHEEERKAVADELSSIGLNHVMAESEENLEATRLSILKLAKGDLNAVILLTKNAKADFRDVIMWASE